MIIKIYKTVCVSLGRHTNLILPGNLEGVTSEIFGLQLEDE